MSGGSFDYLFLHDLLAASRVSDIDRMAARLEELGHLDAAFQTRMAAAHIRLADQRAKKLPDVWQAVEWMDSGDWGPEQLDAAIAKLAPFDG